MMQTLGRYYVQYFNYSYCRTGTLWEGRYKSSLIDTEHYFLTCMRYIELNPVRAQMVSHPAEYSWSSYQCNALGQSDLIVTQHLEYQKLGMTAEERQSAYQCLFKTYIDEKTLEELRTATNKTWCWKTIAAADQRV